MNFRQKNHIEKADASQYASIEDFCRLFTKNMDSLYRLAFLLTADRDKAEQCFTAGFEDSVQANWVFQSCAHSWAKRMIVQNAIEELEPQPGAARAARASIGNDVSRYFNDFELYPVLALEDFQRFVFVMSVLERYSDHECSLLLGCVDHDIGEARLQAFQEIGDSSCIVQPAYLYA